MATDSSTTTSDTPQPPPPPSPPKDSDNQQRADALGSRSGTQDGSESPVLRLKPADRTQPDGIEQQRSARHELASKEGSPPGDRIEPPTELAKSVGEETGDLSGEEAGEQRGDLAGEEASDDSDRTTGQVPDEPAGIRAWTTIADEAGDTRSFPNYDAAKRVLGTVPGTEIHHIVEQTQAKPERSGFSSERINTTDNLTRIPTEVHQVVSAFYSSKPPGFSEVVRDSLNGRSWGDQYDIGSRVLNRAFEGDDGDDD